MQKPINMLFLSLHHRINDPRLCYREIRVIKDKIPESQVFILTLSSNQGNKSVEHNKSIINVQDHTVTHVDVKYQLLNKYPLINPFYNSLLKIYMIFYLAAVCRKLKLDVVQASDARELFLATTLSKICRFDVIYDSHEDYFRQILDYRAGVIKKYILAFKILLCEVLLIRFFSAVFCTDEFLVGKYSKRLYGAKRLNLLRNYPYLIKEKQRTYECKNILRLVYIGGVNKHRGVIECAKYVKLFNDEHYDKKLMFDVYSPKTPITDDLKEKGLINHTEWIDYLDLMNKLYEYDVGICLWLPIKKFYRNLPLKNFDYMASGLPIITSNFGNLKKYIIKSDAGICISPNSYQEFKEAILKMFDPDIRKKYSSNGFMWVKEHGSFENEAKEYVKIIQGLST